MKPEDVTATMHETSSVVMPAFSSAFLIASPPTSAEPVRNFSCISSVLSCLMSSPLCGIRIAEHEVALLDVRRREHALRHLVLQDPGAAKRPSWV